MEGRGCGPNVTDQGPPPGETAELVVDSVVPIDRIDYHIPGIAGRSGHAQVADALDEAADDVVGLLGQRVEREPCEVK